MDEAPDVGGPSTAIPATRDLPIERLARIGAILLPPLVLIVYLVVFSRLQLGSRWYLFRPGLVGELALLVYVSLCVQYFQARTRLALALFLIAGIALYTAVFVKYAFLHEPLRLFDLWLIDELAFVAPLIVKVLVLLVVISLLGSAVYNWRWPTRSVRVCLLTPGIVYLVAVALFPTSVRQLFDSIRPPDCCRIDHNSFRNGPVYGLLRDGAADVALLRALSSISPDSTSAGRTIALDYQLQSGDRRNVHLVVLESFLDPLRFRNLELPSDPVAPLLRSFMNAAASAALSPTFGGGSAAAEFELLCGLPSYRIAGFEHFHFRGNPVPCLPEMLRRHGYRTMVTNLSPGQFYNYTKTYRSFGFLDTYLEGDFEIDQLDRDGPWVSSEKVFRENLALVEQALREGRPILNHVVTGSGHTPYELHSTVRPPIFGRTSPHHRIANAVYYNSRAAAEFVAALEELDPRAIIVITSDHAPPVALDYQSYRAEDYALDGRMLERQARLYQEEERDALAVRRVELVVRYQGRSVPVGTIPHYSMPEIVLDLMSSGDFCRQRRCLSDDDILLRPLGSRPVFVDRSAYIEPICLDGEKSSERCRAAWSNHEELSSAYRELLAQGMWPRK